MNSASFHASRRTSLLCSAALSSVFRPLDARSQSLPQPTSGVIKQWLLGMPRTAELALNARF